MQSVDRGVLYLNLDPSTSANVILAKRAVSSFIYNGVGIATTRGSLDCSFIFSFQSSALLCPLVEVKSASLIMIPSSQLLDHSYPAMQATARLTFTTWITFPWPATGILGCELQIVLGQLRGYPNLPSYCI